MNPLRVYVAGASTEIKRVMFAIRTLQLAGVGITCTWPGVVAATPGGANPADASKVDRAGWSMQDLREVVAADALLFLVPRPPATTRGAWLESGVALATRKHVVFAGVTTQSVFCALGEEFETDADAIAHVIAFGFDRQQTQPVELVSFEMIDQRFDDGGPP